MPRKRFRSSYERKIWNDRYYRRNKDSILEQQRDYRQKNRYNILKRRRERYQDSRKSSKPYKTHRRIKETEDNIVRLKEKLEETEFKLKQLAKDYVVLDKKKEETVRSMTEARERLSQIDKR